MTSQQARADSLNEGDPACLDEALACDADKVQTAGLRSGLPHKRLHLIRRQSAQMEHRHTTTQQIIDLSQATDTRTLGVVHEHAKIFPLSTSPFSSVPMKLSIRIRYRAAA